jgi:tetratricopeptide (TPR) repeat protein/predicted Ser/Thr protein kinase
VGDGDDASSSSAGLSASKATQRLGPREDLATVPERGGASASQVSASGELRAGDSGNDPKDRSQDPLLPARIGRFAINRRLGAGGMGVVYEAEDRQLGRKIAIKLLRTALPSDDDDDGGESVGKLLREAQTLAKLDHPNVVAVHEVGVLEGEVFVAMEFIEGQTLRQWLRERPREWPEVRDALVQAGRGLAAAHRAGLVHRDFKPENAMIDVQGRVRVLDFGLARAAGTGPPSSLIARMLHSGTTGGQSVSVAGTPAYMAPEQHLGLPCDARSDQFSFCVALYEGLYGVRPFPDGDAAQRFQAIMAGELRRPVRGRKAPHWLRAALVRGLQSVPNKRFPKMDALIDALTEAPKRRRRAWVAASLIALSGAAAGLGLSLYVETRDACGPYTDRVASLWAARRDALREAIVAAGPSYARATFGRLDALMQERAAEWGAMYAATCEAYRRAPVEQEAQLDLRMTCLNHQARDIEAALKAMSEEPEAAARHAVKVESQLDPVAACGDVAALRAFARPAADVHATLEAEKLRLLLAEVQAATELGRYKPALARAETLLAAARGFGDQALTAEALLRIGNLHKWLAEYKRAQTTLEDAYWMALGAGDDKTAAEAAGALLLVTGHHLADRAVGRIWERSAAALLRRVPDPRVAAAFYNNRGIVYVDAGDYAAADVEYGRALEIYRAEKKEHNPKVALVLGNMSRVAYMRGDLATAAQRLEESLATRERAFGDGHPESAITMSNLALVLSELGELARAEELLRQALVIEETIYGPRHPKLAPTLDNLAKTLARQGRFDEALQLSYRALHVLESAEAPNLATIAEVKLGIGLAYALQRRFGEGLPELREALALREKQLGPDHPDTAQARIELAEALLLAGEVDEVFGLVGAGVASKIDGGTRAQIAVVQALRGRVLLAHGDVELARSVLRSVLPDLEAGAPLPRGRARAALARALGPRGRAEALTLAELAEADLSAAGAGFEREREAIAAFRAGL